MTQACSVPKSNSVPGGKVKNMRPSTTTAVNNKFQIVIFIVDNKKNGNKTIFSY